MARRADHSRNELAKLIEKTAQEIIAAQGLSALTTRKIGTAVGYSPGTIYNVFDDLNGVISRVNALTLRDLNHALAQVHLTGDVMVDAHAILQEYLSFQKAHPKLWAAVMLHSARADLSVSPEYTDALDAAFAQVEHVIAPAFQGHPENDVKTAVRVLWASLQGISSLPDDAEMVSVPGQSKADLCANLVDTYLKGVVANRARTR